MNDDWHVIKGKWEIGETSDGKSFMHKGNNDETFKDSLLLNKKKLIDGEIKANIVFNSLPPDSASVVFRYQSPHNYYFAGIGGYGKKFVIGKRLAKGSYAINTLGVDQDIEASTIYSIALTVSGRKFSLFLNGENGRIKIIDAVDTMEPFYDGGNIGIKVFGKADATIDGFSCETKKPRCFVVMPFGDDKLNKLKIYDKIIKEVVENKENNLNCDRSDEILGNRPIIMDIVEAIDTSLITICEITQDNANVFYELGIAHAQNANVILLRDKTLRDKLPFDISHIRCIDYHSDNFDKKEIKKIKKKLTQTIKSILDKTMNYAQQGSALNFQL